MVSRSAVLGLLLVVCVPAGLPAQADANALDTAQEAELAARQAMATNDRQTACTAIRRGLAALDRDDRDHRSAVAAARRSLALLARNAGNAPGAAELARHAWRGVVRDLEGQHPPDQRMLWEARRALSHACELLGDVQGAIDVQRAATAAAIAHEGATSRYALDEHGELIRLLIAGGKDDEARTEIEKSFAAQGRPQGLEVERELAIRMAETGRRKAALALFERIHAQSSKLGAPPVRVLQDLENVALTQKDLGQFQQAHDSMVQILAAYETTAPGSRQHLGALQNFATFLSDQDICDQRVADHYRRALSGYERLRQEQQRLREQGRDVPPDAVVDAWTIETCRWELAQHLARDGDYLAALDLAQTALANMSADPALGPEAGPTTWARGVIARVRSELGDYQEAEHLYRENLRIRQEVLQLSPLSVPMQHVRRHLANMLRLQGRTADAVALLRETLAAMERQPEPPLGDTGYVKRLLAHALCDAGQAAEAAELMRAVVAASSREDSPETAAISRIYLARCLWLAGDQAAARALFDADAPKMRQSFGLRDYSFCAQAACCVYAADPGAAVPLTRLLDELLQRSEEHLLRNPALPPRQALEEARLIDSIAEFVLSFAARAEAGRRQELTARAFGLLESLRGAALQSAHVFAQTADDPEIRQLRLEANLARAQLQALSVGPVAAEDAGASAEKVRQDARQRDATTGKALRTALRKHDLDHGAVTVAGLQQALQANEVVVCYREWQQTTLAPGTPTGVLRARRLLAQVVSKKHGLQQQDLGDAAAVGALVDRWYAAILSGESRGRPAGGSPVDDPAAALTQQILVPVLKLVEQAAGPLPKARVHLCLDDGLQKVPFEALPHLGKPIGDKCTILFEPTLARLVAPPPKLAAPPSLLLVGDIDYAADPGPAVEGPAAAPPVRGGPGDDRETRPLPGTREEIDAAAAAWKSRKDKPPAPQVLARGAATKKAFVAAAEGKRFLHLGTHGQYRQDALVEQPGAEPAPGSLEFESAVRGYAPMALCFLEFAGAATEDVQRRAQAYLTAEELAGLDLRGCELAVLSACSTMVGEHSRGHGQQSLQMALHAAGARSVIATRWPVDDRQTARLMATFYRELWTKGASKAEALRHAKEELRKADPNGPMLHWAAFVLTGDPQ